MTNVSAAKWQDQARTVLSATINGAEWSGISASSRFWNKVLNSGVPIADPDPPLPPEIAPLTTEELYDMLAAKVPPVLVAADRPRPKPSLLGGL